MEVYGSFNDKRGAQKNTKRQDAMDSITASPKAAENLKQLSRKYKNDEDFLLDAIEKQPAVYMYVSKKFKNDSKFRNSCVIRNYKVVPYIEGASASQAVEYEITSPVFAVFYKRLNPETEKLWSDELVAEMKKRETPVQGITRPKKRKKKADSNESQTAQPVAQQGNETVQVTEPAKPKENNGQTEQTSVETPKEETAEATAEGTEKKKGLVERLKARMQQRKSDKATNKLYKLLTKGPFNKDDKEEADRLIKEEGANINDAVSRMSEQKRYPDEAWAYLTEKLPELKQEEEKLKQKPKENNGQTEQTSVETPKEETAEATAEGTEKKKGWFERLKAHMQKRKSDKKKQKSLIEALKADKFDKKVVEELIQQGAVITDKIIKGKTKYSKEACEFIQQLAQPQVQQPKSEESNNETVETPKEAPKKEFANEEEKFVWDTYQELCDLKLPAGYSFEKLKSKLEQIAKTSKTTEVKEKAEDCIEILNYLRKKLDLTIEKIDSERSIKEIAIEREDALKFKKAFDKEFAEQKNKEAAEKENKKLLEKLNKIVKTKKIDIRRGQQSSEEEKE